MAALTLPLMGQLETSRNERRLNDICDLQVSEYTSGAPNINNPWTRTERWEGAIGFEPFVVALCVSRLQV